MSDRIRVWGYRDGVLLPDGFETGTDYSSGRVPATVSDEVGALLATVAGLVALLRSVGVEPAMGEGNDDVVGIPEWHETEG